MRVAVLEMDERGPERRRRRVDGRRGRSYSFPYARCRAVGSGGPLVVPLNSLLNVTGHKFSNSNETLTFPQENQRFKIKVINFVHHWL